MNLLKIIHKLLLCLLSIAGRGTSRKSQNGVRDVLEFSSRIIPHSIGWGECCVTTLVNEALCDDLINGRAVGYLSLRED